MLSENADDFRCYVVIPTIAQSGVNDSTLEVISLELTNPSPTSFHMKQVTRLNSTSQYHPWLDPFNASLSLAGSSSYGQILLPGTQSLDSQFIIIEQDVQITDMAAFTAYNVALLGNAGVTVAVDGQTLLHEGAFPASTVNFNKRVAMKGEFSGVLFDSDIMLISAFSGLNGLKGFNVTQFQLSLVPLPDGSNINGTVYIPNTSSLTFDLVSAVPFSQPTSSSAALHLLSQFSPNSPLRLYPLALLPLSSSSLLLAHIRRATLP